MANLKLQIQTVTLYILAVKSLPGQKSKLHSKFLSRLDHKIHKWDNFTWRQSHWKQCESYGPWRASPRRPSSNTYAWHCPLTTTTTTTAMLLWTRPSQTEPGN